MSDYDPKSIPVLDDILDVKLSDDSNSKKKDNKAIEPEIGAIDAFEEAPQMPDTTAVDVSEDKIESALVDYSAEDNTETTDDWLSNNSQTNDSHASASRASDFEATSALNKEVTPPAEKLYTPKELPPVMPVPQTSTSAAETQTTQAEAQPSLDSLLDDIVKQLMPELEQQLRFLLQQNLEDKLPDDILKRLNSSKNKS